MNRDQKHPLLFIRSPAYRPAFEGPDNALEENTPSGNFEKIRLMRRVLFGDVEKLQQSEGIKIPK